MLVGSDAGATTKRRPRSDTRERNENLHLIEHLRAIAREHDVCYEIWPLCASDGKSGKGFELLLCGVNGHVIRERGALHAVSCCQGCTRTYFELKEIADWIVGLKRSLLRYKIHSFDRAFHLAPKHREHRSEIVIRVSIDDPDHRVRGSYVEGETLKKVRSRLSKLGIYEDTLLSAGSTNS
jgi:hypothetical protein